MPVVSVTVHPRGLHPLEAARAYHLHEEEGLSLDSVRDEVFNMEGNRPSKKAVWTAVRQVKALEGNAVPQTNYENCGRKRMLTAEDEAAIVEFVKKWRGKRFCTCKYIAQALKLKTGRNIISRALNRHGYFWRPVPKIRGLSAAELEKRKAFVDEHWQRPASWWEENMNLVLDGVTLTMPPKPLSSRQRHMAQSIKHTWMLQGENQSPDLHTFNRYGVQLGIKVPLWGGFTGRGHFTLREWTPRPKMNKVEWAQRVPALRRAVDLAGEPRRRVQAKVWQDNERFLMQPQEYRKAGLVLVNFPPNSGDLNPIETVWVQLRKDLAKREQDDFAAGRVLTMAQFRQRAAQLLKSYGEVRENQKYSFLRKLVRGMPLRLRRSRELRYGRCGK